MWLQELFEFVVDSPAFQQWYAGSKLLDASGQPLKLYHGTSKDQAFKKFRMPGNGVWFTTSAKDASEYALQNDSMDTKPDWNTGRYVKVHTASRVMPLYVRAMNPLVIDQLPDALITAGSNSDNSTLAYRRAQREWFAKVRRDGHDAIMVGDHTVIAIGGPEQIRSAITTK